MPDKIGTLIVKIGPLVRDRIVSVIDVPLPYLKP